MKLSIRLRAAADMVPSDSFLLDIGCDHAWLPIVLVQEENVKSALASDVRIGPLSAALHNIRTAGLEGRIGTVLADGISQNWKELLPGYRSDGADKSVACTILGMGGRMIASICSDAFEEEGAHGEGITDLIVSPQRDEDLCRRTLIRCGFDIIDETYVEEEGKGYPIIHAVPGNGKACLSDEEAYYRPVLTRRMPDLYRMRLEKRRELLLSIRNRLPAHLDQRRTEIERELAAVENVLKGGTK